MFSMWPPEVAVSARTRPRDPCLTLKAEDCHNDILVDVPEHRLERGECFLVRNSHCHKVHNPASMCSRPAPHAARIGQGAAYAHRPPARPGAALASSPRAASPCAG